MPWQPLPMVFPDVELVVTAGLRTLLLALGQDGVHVDRRIPEDRHDRMVVVNRDGGHTDGVTDHPLVRIRVWDTDADAANTLAGLVPALMTRLVGTTPITRVDQLSGPYEVPDTSRGHQRYLLFQVHTEGAQLP